VKRAALRAIFSRAPPLLHAARTTPRSHHAPPSALRWRTYARTARGAARDIKRWRLCARRAPGGISCAKHGACAYRAIAGVRLKSGIRRRSWQRGGKWRSNEMKINK